MKYCGNIIQMWPLTNFYGQPLDACKSESFKVFYIGLSLLWQSHWGFHQLIEMIIEANNEKNPCIIAVLKEYAENSM